MVTFTQLLYKFRFSIAVVVLTLLLIFTRLHYLNKYEESVNAFIKYKHEQTEKRARELQLTKMTQEKLVETYIKEIENLKVKNENINKQYSINQSELNSVYQTLRENRNTSTNAPSSSLLVYIDTLSELLGERSKLATENAKAAETATAEAIMYYNIAIEQKQIVDKYNEDLREIK